MALSRADRDVVGMSVLALLMAGPRHTYEMHRLMIDTRKDFVTGLPRSMYHAVERLEQAGHIEPVASVRDGAKPERIIYAITDRGREQVCGHIERLLAHPDADATLTIAALSFIVCLAPARASHALRARTVALTSRIEQLESDLAAVQERLPRALLVESEYELTSARSERGWVKQLLNELERGDLTWSTDVTQLANIGRNEQEEGPAETAE